MHPSSLKTIALALEYPLSLRGGVSVLVETFAIKLSAHYRIVLVSPDTDEQFRQSIAACHSVSHIFWNPDNPTVESSRRLAAALVAQKVDLAHFHSGGNFGWGMRWPGRTPMPYVDRAGIPCVLTAHQVARGILEGYCGPAKPLWFKLALFPITWVGKLHALKHLQAEIGVSEHDTRLMRKWYWPFRDRYRTVYHSRIEEDLTPAAPELKEPFVLAVGHIAFRKGQHILAEAFAKIAHKYPQWNLLLAGPIAEQECDAQIQEIIDKYAISGRIVRLGSRDDALELMRRASIFVQPSLLEALGLALQEALTLECACIGTKVGGIPELIQDGETGILVPPRDPDAMANALEKLILDADLRRRFGACAPARLRMKGMTVNRMVEEHLSLYEHLIRAR